MLGKLVFYVPVGEKLTSREDGVGGGDVQRSYEEFYEVGTNVMFENRSNLQR